MLKKILSLCLLAALTVVLPDCQKKDYRYTYVNLAEFFPYLTRGMEVSTLKFVGNDLRESRYRLSGFKTYKDQLPRNWAVEKESSITPYFTELEDKKVILRCRPFNPPGQPLQEGEIFFNGTFLKKMVVATRGQYRLDLPASLMVYGSNRLSFKWKFSRSHADFGINNDKRKYAVGFNYLSFRGAGKKRIKTREHRRIRLQRQGSLPALLIPQGTLVEYVVNLPADRIKPICRARYVTWLFMVKREKSSPGILEPVLFSRVKNTGLILPALPAKPLKLSLPIVSAIMPILS
jgi:hypothetical protein